MNSKGGRRPGTWLMAGGLLLMAAALLLTGYNLWSEERAGNQADQVLAQLEARIPQPEGAGETAEESVPEPGGEVEIPDYLLNPEMEMPTVEIGGNDYIGTLEIPALELSLPVMSDWSYPQLRISPCRYQGSAYQDNLILLAHNYQRHFGRLKNLSPGAEVVFTDVDGNRFCYQVVEIQILAPTAVEEMEAGDWDLSLFTCTLGGRTRVTVRCDRVEG